MKTPGHFWVEINTVGKSYPASFECYHLILYWPDLKRAATSAAGSDA